ncbi:MAG: hypothetical protein SXA11_19915 [Cyanobacteriota bacterium]|nr:hypothetical protein [Cyanobacteriota bacterium]
MVVTTGEEAIAAELRSLFFYGRSQLTSSQLTRIAIWSYGLVGHRAIEVTKSLDLVQFLADKSSRMAIFKFFDRSRD